MRKLKYEEITYKQVEYHELEDLILHVYKQEYEIVVGEEQRNDSLIRCRVEKEEFDNYSKERVKEFIETGDESYMLTYLLQDMCNRDIIEEGNYLIDISW